MSYFDWLMHHTPRRYRRHCCYLAEGPEYNNRVEPYTHPKYIDSVFTDTTGERYELNPPVGAVDRTATLAVLRR